MKKVIIIFFFCAFTSLANANNGVFNEIRIPKEFKTENTFSGDLSDKDSFHLIFAKNKKTKNYKVFSYLFDGNTSVELPSLINEKSYGVVSFHQKNNILSLLLSYKIKKESFIKTVHYNLITKEKKEFKAVSHNDFMTSIRTKDQSILIYKTDDAFIVSSFVGNNKPHSKELVLDKDSDVKTFFKNESVTSIKTDEFVANGSTNKVRLYFENNTLFFTRDSDEHFNFNLGGIPLNNKKANITQLLKFNLSKSTLKPVFFSFENANGEKFKKATSFFTKDKLFQLALSKKTGFINIADVNTGKSLNVIALDELLSNKIKGNPEFQGIEKFLKNAGKNKYNATITANKTKSDKIRVRVDYVDISYNYNYNWWWHHQQFMWHMQQHQMQMIQQNIQRNIPTGFGPRIVDDYVFENAVILKEKRFFELLIDLNGSLIDDELPETIYKEIDKKEYIDKLDEIATYSNESSCFLKDSFRFIAYDKKHKKFVIQTNTIK